MFVILPRICVVFDQNNSSDLPGPFTLIAQKRKHVVFQIFCNSSDLPGLFVCADFTKMNEIPTEVICTYIYIYVSMLFLQALRRNNRKLY